MPDVSGKSIVFITGTFISDICWEEWIAFFENKGYKCIAPPWPGKEAPAEELRNRPADDAIAQNTIHSLTDYFAAVISQLPDKPIIIGHSLGGLVAQLLLQRNLAFAAVAVHSFPPRGVSRFRISFLRAVWASMMLFTSSRETYLISFKKWKYAIANGMAYKQQKELYYRYAVPESKKIIRDLFSCSTAIDYKKSHEPLLFTAGCNDQLIPASLNYSNYKTYGSSHSITDYRKFKGQNHLVFGHPGWRKEADFILYWLQGL